MSLPHSLSPAMSTTIKNTCPLCDYAIEPKDRLCPNCGVDLALATTIAEHALASNSITIRSEYSISPEILVPKIGEYMVENGHVTPEQLNEALEYQNRGPAGVVARDIIAMIPRVINFLLSRDADSCLLLRHILPGSFSVVDFDEELLSIS